MDLMEYRRKIIANSPHLSSVSGAVVSFSDGADLPLKSLIVDIDPVQSGTGDPSPTNVRPISGWSAAKVTRTGKNLFGGEAFRDAVLSAVSTATTGEDENGRYVTVTAGAAANQKIIFKFPFKTNTAYTFAYTWSKDNTNGIANIGFKYTDGANGYLSKSGTIQANTVYSETTQSASNKTVSYMMAVWGSGTAKIYYDYFGVFEVMDVYHPYTGTSLTVQLGRTVYGGTLNVLTGELVAYPYYASYNGETLTGRWVSDRDKYVAGTTPTIGAQVVDMSGTGTTYHLDPQTVRSLVGNNNIFADTGNVALEYWAHP